VGILVGSDTITDITDGFKAQMTELGYVEGKNIIYDLQDSNADAAEGKRMANKFVTDQVDMIFAFPTEPALAAKAAAQGTKIPVVFANAFIEGTSLVDNVRSPGGNITGVRFPGPDTTLKSLESFLELTPRAERIVTIYDPTYPIAPFTLAALRPAALSSNVTLQEIPVTTVQDIRTALQERDKLGDNHMDAILLLSDTVTRSSEGFGLIINFADRHRVPVVGGSLEVVRNGSVLGVTTDHFEQGKSAASLADKILKGTPAGTLPVVSPELHLYINYRKAQELGLMVPDGLLRQASEIVR